MVIISVPRSFLKERRYILSVIIGEFLGLDYRVEERGENETSWVIQMPDGINRLILPDILFAKGEGAWLTLDSLPEQPLKHWDPRRDFPEKLIVDASIPIIYGVDPAAPGFVQICEHEIRLGLDVFGSAFFLLTRYEEVVRTERDGMGRFPMTASIAFQENFLHRPIVNEYLEILWISLKRLWPGLERKPRGYCPILTHDVDSVAFSMNQNLLAFLKGAAGDILKRHSPGLARERISGYHAALGGNFEYDPCNTFGYIMDVAEAVGLKSSFFFIGSTDPSTIKRHYDIKHPWVKGLMKSIHQRGHSIEFHPTYGTCANVHLLAQEFQEIATVCNGLGIQDKQWCGRQHRLEWINPTTWSNYDQVGLCFDSTLTFPEQPGFRCGVCYEYRAFDLLSKKMLNVRERPLIVMDTSLFSYMQCGFQEAAERTIALCRTCRAYRGDFVGLWHNSKLISREQQFWYRKLIEAVA